MIEEKYLPEEKEIEVSKRFLGENEEPLKWKIKAIKEKERVRECFYKEEDKYQIGVRVIALNDKQMEEYLKQIGITKIENNIKLLDYINLLGV